MAESNKASPFLQRSLTYQHGHRPSKSTFGHHSDPKAPKAVLFFTSLRGVRKTFDDCRAVRAALRALRVAVDERDVSMDAAFRLELKSLLPNGRPFALPQLFVAGRWLGGAEQLLALQESGELAAALAGVAKQETGFCCRACAGFRFVPCGECSGSRKVYDEDEERIRRCCVCNENGLVRCTDCCF